MCWRLLESDVARRLRRSCSLRQRLSAIRRVSMSLRWVEWETKLAVVFAAFWKNWMIEVVGWDDSAFL